MLMAVMAFSLSAWCDNPSPISEDGKEANAVTEYLVTDSMSVKIAEVCLLNEGNTRSTFYRANDRWLTPGDIHAGKGKEILMNLNKYPKYAENFIREIFRMWGYNGLKEIGFNENEINISKKIIANQK